MKKDIKERWISDLRSGKFQQGQQALRAKSNSGKDRYCCIGVLAEQLCELGVLRRSESTETYSGYSYADAEGRYSSWSALTYSAREYTGVSEEAINKLISMNDGRMLVDGKFCKFPEIADWIEENL